MEFIPASSIVVDTSNPCRSSSHMTAEKSENCSFDDIKPVKIISMPDNVHSEDDIVNGCSTLSLTNGVSSKQELADNQIVSAKSCPLELSLTSQGFECIPDSLLDADVGSRVEKLDLAYNSLVAIPDALFHNLSNIVVLSFSGNDLTELPSAISNLHDLHELDVCSNKLSAFPSSIVTLTRLQSINFSCNVLEYLPTEFGRLTSLETVTGYENKLQRLPDTFGLLRRLRVLELGDNALSCLPRNFGFLRSLQSFNLSNNKLEMLPDNIFHLQLLEFVDLSGNSLTSLPERFHSQKTLRRLFVDSNCLKTLPEWIGELPELEELGVKNNHLVDCPLPEKFGEVCKKLHVLELAGNYITRLPDSLGKLTNLERLHIGSVIDELERANFQNGNWIWKLPSSFGHLTALLHANMNENQICELPANFGDLSSLEWLDLGQNRLVDLPESFGNLRSLKYCQLSKNKLELLPSSFGNLSTLEEIRLDHNLLYELPESFCRLTQLKTLDLFNNKLREIPTFLETFTQLTRLDLNENSFGLHFTRVPLLTHPNKYAPRDSSLSDNWRGRRRVDITDVEIAKVVERDEDYDPDNEAPPEVLYNTSAYEYAVRRNMSLWRSHGTKGDRPVYAVDEGGQEAREDGGDGRRLFSDLNVADEEEDEWSCDEESHSSESARSEAGKSNLSQNSQPSSVNQPAASVLEQPEEDWDSEITEVVTDSSAFDLDDGYTHIARPIKRYDAAQDYRTNPFFCLPSILHCPSYVTYKAYPTCAYAFGRSVAPNPSQFDDA